MAAALNPPTPGAFQPPPPMPAGFQAPVRPLVYPTPPQFPVQAPKPHPERDPNFQKTPGFTVGPNKRG